MKALGLRGRFLIAGLLIVATSAGSSAWSALAFRRMSRVVDVTVRDSEETTDATGTLASDLEREDDALLLSLADAARGRRELEDRRLAVGSSLARVDALLDKPDERDRAASLRRDVEGYHAAGDALIARVLANAPARGLEPDDGARIRYHEEVNPLLRRAVAGTTLIREQHFRSTQRVAAWARDQARQAMQILAFVFAAALLLSMVVAFYLTRVVLLPIGELSRAVEALRRGDFTRRPRAHRRDELGQLAAGFNRMADDLEEFRRANIGEVIAAKETLEATLAALPDAVVVIEPGGRVSSANPRASDVMRALHGASSRHVRELPLPDAVRAAVEASLRGETVNVPLDLSRSIAVQVGEEHRRLLPRIVPIARFANGRYGAVLLLSDVTELVRLDEMRMELVAVASHELRTPLTTLRMTLLMLEERAARLEATDRELVATALLGVEQLATTVGEFLDLTRIEAGQLRLHRDRVDVEPLVRDAMTTIQSICDESNVPLLLNVHENAPRVIWGDAARLGVVFSNVLRNAAKYTPPGGTIEISVDGPDGAASAKHVRIAITDAGPGVPDEFRRRIFDKFFRVEHYRPDEEAGVLGSGIGLYIACEIVEAHGGTIACEAGPGERGARFVILLQSEQGPTEQGEGSLS